jgi:hypothetical protein
MKTTYVLLVTLVVPFVAVAQDRPRYFDNFDTSSGVQVIRSEAPAAAPKLSLSQASNGTRAKKLSSKTAAVSPRPLFQPQMRVSEGLAEREGSPLGAGSVKTATTGGMKGFTTGNPVFDSYIVESSRRYNIDPLLIYAQMHQESSFKVQATSYKGASGLMQLMPATARRLGVTNIYDPKQNIEGGVKYMRMLLDMFDQDVHLALAGYNAGEGAVMKYGYQIPPYSETREYVRRISARYNAITDGSYARNYRSVSKTEAARLETRESRPLTIYEPDAVAIRLADGRMRLVNQ